jgi:phage-related minor tail protein
MSLLYLQAPNNTVFKLSTHIVITMNRLCDIQKQLNSLQISVSKNKNNLKKIKTAITVLGGSTTDWES